MSSVFLLIRLAIATGLVLAPGAIAARAVGVRSTSATLAWGLGIVFAAMTVVFAVHASLTLALVLLLVAALVAAPFAIRRPPVPEIPGRAWVWAAGAVLGLLLWHVAGEIGGDGLFHLARARKLVEFGDLRLSSRERVRRRRAPPGLRLPALAGVPGADREGRLRRPVEGRAPRGDRAGAARRAGRLRGGLRAVPAGRAGRGHGRRRGRDRGDGGRARRLVHLARAAGNVVAPAPRPGRARARVRGACALRRKGSSRASALASLVLAVVHPTYAIFLWIPFAGFLAVRWAWRCEKVGSGSLTLAALVVPGRALPRLAPARRAQDGLGQPRRARARARASSTTPASSTARPISSGSRRRCSAARARSRLPRCS